MSYRHVSLDAKTRYKGAISSFKGIDYANQRFSVSFDHAIDASNFIYRDGVTQVRHGIQEAGNAPTFKIHSLYDDSYFDNPTNINAFWNFKDEFGDSHLIAHVGRILCFVAFDSNGVATFAPIVTGTTTVEGITYYETWTLLNENYGGRNGFVGNKRFWMLGGEKFLCLRFYESGKYHFYCVEDHQDADYPEEDTYIPTTTTSIVTTDTSADDARLSLDDVSLLTMWRKNEITNAEETDETELFQYELDGVYCNPNEDTTSCSAKVEISTRSDYELSPLYFPEDGKTDGLVNFSYFIDALVAGASCETSIYIDGELVESDGERDNVISYGFKFPIGVPLRADNITDSGDIVIKEKCTYTDGTSRTFSFKFDDLLRYADGKYLSAYCSGGSVNSIAQGVGNIAEASISVSKDGTAENAFSLCTLRYSAYDLAIQTSGFENFYLASDYRINEEIIIPANSFLIIEGGKSGTIQGVATMKEINGYKVIVDEGGAHIYGFIENVYPANSAEGKDNVLISFFNNYVPLVDGTTAITVTYPCYTEGYPDYINKCRFGHLFGNNNAKNRLFVSGNPDKGNCDWHSGSGVNGDDNGDFSYFSDMDYCFYGQTDNDVAGYDIISDGQLAVYKTKSDKEPTVYYRSSNLTLATDAAGNSQNLGTYESLYEEAYPLTIGNIGDGAYGQRSIINFNGDSLFLSQKNMVCGVDSSGEIATTKRFAVTRSAYIDPKLRGLDLSNAVLWTNNTYMFLSTGSELYASHFESAENSQYNWWKLGLSNVTAFIEYGDKIYIGRSNGSLGCFGEDFIDRCVISCSSSLTTSAGKYSFEKSLASRATGFTELKVVDYGGSLIAKAADSSSYTIKRNHGDAGCWYLFGISELASFLTSEILKGQKENKIRVSVVVLNSSGQIKSSSKIVVDDNAYHDAFSEYPNGLAVYVTEEAFTELGLVADEDVVFAYAAPTYDSGFIVTDASGSAITDISNGEFYLCLNYKTGDAFTRCEFLQYGTYETHIIGMKNVDAYYITAPFTGGDLMNNKTIWAWSLTNDTDFDSYVQVAQATNEVDFDDMAVIASFNNVVTGYDYENYEFGGTDYEKRVVPSKYTFIYPLNVPFICFGLRNESGKNAALSILQVVYTLSGSSFATK